MFKIEHHGQIIVNTDVETPKWGGNDGFILGIDLDSKNAEVGATGQKNGIPVLDLMAGDYTRHYLPVGEPTSLSFPDFRNFLIVAAQVSRYTLFVTLISPSLKAAEPDLLKVLRDCVQYVPLNVVECSGRKCREPWCADCFGEEEAQNEIEKAGRVLQAAQAAIEKATYSGEEPC